MHNLPGAIPMPRGRTGQLPVPGLLLVGDTCPVAAGSLFRPTAPVQTSVEGAFGQGRHPTLDTRMMVGTGDSTGGGLRRLLERIPDESVKGIPGCTICGSRVHASNGRPS